MATSRRDFYDHLILPVFTLSFTATSMIASDTATSLRLTDRSPLPRLPDELVLTIFEHLAPYRNGQVDIDAMFHSNPETASPARIRRLVRNLHACSQVCRQWARCASPLLWEMPVLADTSRDILREFLLNDKALYRVQCLSLSPDTTAKSNLDSKLHTGELLQFLGECKRIKHLDLSGLGYTTLKTIDTEMQEMQEMQAMHRTDTSSPKSYNHQRLPSHALARALCSTSAQRNLRSLRMSAWIAEDVDHTITELCHNAIDSFERDNDGSPFQWSALTHLDLSDCYKMRDRTVCMWVERAPRLRHLNVSSLPFMGEACINALCAAPCRLTLERLNASFCILVTDRAVHRVLSACSKLKSLDISHCSGMTRHVLPFDEIHVEPELRYAIPAMQSSFANIQHLSMVFASIDDRAIDWIAEHGHSLEHLELRSCREITYDAVARLLRRRGTTGDSERDIREGRKLVHIDLSFCYTALALELGDDAEIREAVGIDGPEWGPGNALMRFRNVKQVWPDRGCIMSGKSIADFLKYLEQDNVDME